MRYKLDRLTKSTKEEVPPVEVKLPERRPRRYGRRWGWGPLLLMIALRG